MAILENGSLLCTWLYVSAFVYALEIVINQGIERSGM